LKVVAAILAAGRGERFGADKTSLLLGGRPVWRWSFETYASHPAVDEVFVVTAPSRLDTLSVAVIAGGETRQQSSFLALEEARRRGADLVLIHDAARPFISSSLISAVIEAAVSSGAAAAALPVTDTIKEVTDAGVRTLRRQDLVAMQTPQAARTQLLYEAHQAIGEQFTDEMGLLEAFGVHPVIVPGEPNNFKITTPEDFARAQFMVGTETRSGIGYDVHPFSDDPSRVLWLGGVEFPGHRALDGHSDADVILHAVTDAVLGAAAMGDIGVHFPNTDPEWKGKASIYFLEHAGRLLCEAGWRVVNIDATCVAESPKIMKRADDIRSVMAAALGISVDRVSIKATTNEQMGFVGRGEGIAAVAMATIARP